MEDFSFCSSLTSAYDCLESASPSFRAACRRQSLQSLVAATLASRSSWALSDCTTAVRGLSACLSTSGLPPACESYLSCQVDAYSALTPGAALQLQPFLLLAMMSLASRSSWRVLLSNSLLGCVPSPGLFEDFVRRLRSDSLPWLESSRTSRVYVEVQGASSNPMASSFGSQPRWVVALSALDRHAQAPNHSSLLKLALDVL
eukprot:CAMPEP_0203945750 /NCGR_PEP_ID=MMETSP0359-20131031/81199_1 /ASSEMBLY_ACC=CAM_ASM_000338 /TAXON_ID=268821 /ORGANISM="Scrippsiella Hangoei, Strain SHTV-5" /LENGTH=201 /DNA_ID=CAMNT_0050876957 /DNA_START=409 /DNA_END=1012 /DNA_ORIENTATION=+